MQNQINTNGLIRRYQSIEILSTLNAPGRVMFPDQQNLRGAIIQSIILIPDTVAQYSTQSGTQPVAQFADMEATTFTFVAGSDEVIKQIPAYNLNPFIDISAGTNPGRFDRELLANLAIDWNKCYLELWAAPSSSPMFYNIGVYYFYPQNSNAGQQRVKRP